MPCMVSGHLWYAQLVCALRCEPSFVVCRAWTWTSSGKICYLKNGVYARYANNIAVSGVPNRLPGACPWRQLCCYHLPGIAACHNPTLPVH